jgi:hypothetical protein
MKSDFRFQVTGIRFQGLGDRHPVEYCGFVLGFVTQRFTEKTPSYTEIFVMQIFTIKSYISFVILEQAGISLSMPCCDVI